MFTPDERADMLECYLSCNKSPVLALRNYVTKFPQRRHPEKKVFERIYQYFRRNQSLLPRKERGRNVLNDENQLDILLYFEEFSETSTRQATLDLNFKRTTIQTCLKLNGWKPYKYLPVQKLEEGDYNRRLEFCSILMDRHFAENIFRKIVWTDESIFTTATKIYNRKNLHYWSNKNEKKIIEVKTQGRKSVKVWCAILRSRILGPIFYDENLNSARYFQLLSNNIQELIENQVPQIEIRNLIWQQDGAPYHRSQETSQYLSNRYRYWIGENGNLAWPARSPDLTPMDYFLWGTLKEIVYKQKPTTVNELRHRIQEGVNFLNGGQFVQNAISYLETVYTTCIAQNGGHIENLLQ